MFECGAPVSLSVGALVSLSVGAPVSLSVGAPSTHGTPSKLLNPKIMIIKHFQR